MKSLQHSGKSYHLQEFLFVLALVTKPFYLTSSGSMQPSDFIYMALFGCFLLSGRIRFPGWKEKQWAAAFAYLIVYQFVINVIWYFICYFQDIEDLKMVTRIIYYIFNLFVCLSVFQMCVAVGYKRLLKLYLLGSALSLAVCYIGVALNWSGSEYCVNIPHISSNALSVLLSSKVVRQPFRSSVTSTVPSAL